MNYLVSYPHSGNTWVRYAVESITGRPTYGYHKKTVHELMGFKELTDNPILLKRHCVEDITKKDRVILLLRKPSDFASLDNNYLKLLDFVLDMPIGFYIIVEYKKLFNSVTCVNSIYKICKFLGILGENIDSYRIFTKNIDWHLNQCQRFYDNVCRPRQNKSC